MRLLKSTKLGAVLALALAVTMPILAAAPASAETIRTERVDVFNGREHFMPVRYSHRSEVTYRDMQWRDMRFHRHFDSWHRVHQDHSRFGR